MRTLKSNTKNFILFVIMGVAYYGIEILWRGYSHWSMALLGGLCGLLIGMLNEDEPDETSIVKQGIAGTAIVTILEFVCGAIVNVWFGWHIWDYSNMPLNIMGQICVLYSFLWVFLAMFCVLIDDILRYALFQEPLPHYTIFSKANAERE